MRLLEVLTRTRFQVLTFPKGMVATGGNPTGAGSGFILLHKGKSIFVTADHVCHPNDYEHKITKRSFDDKDVAIVNNYTMKDRGGVEMPILTPIGGFYYFDKFKFTADKGFDDFTPYDATFAIMGADRFQTPFLSEPLYVANGEDVPGGLEMIQIPSGNVVTPNSTDCYIVYGHTRLRWAADNVHLVWDINHHEDMVYVREEGDYYVLRPNEPIVNEQWSGISGSPVLNQEGGLLGILCSGRPDLNEIYVMKMQSVLSLIDTTLRIEEIERQKNTDKQ